jgi:hypothetical protein
VRPLRIAVITRPGSIPGQRNAGWFAYTVPEFTWDCYQIPKGATLARERFADYDLIMHEDGKTLIKWLGKGPKLAYLVGDSTLSQEHYETRLEQASQADLILVDWDRLERFDHLGIPTRRWSYCVDDRRFRNHGEGKTVDVAFHMHEADLNGNHRHLLGNYLADLCKRQGWTMSRGVLEGDAYARAFADARVTINVNRNPETRNHRVFDAMACGTCVLTDAVPDVSGEERTEGLDYLEMRTGADLVIQLASLLSGNWEQVASSGYRLVHRAHTWRVRAQQLRAILAEVFGW